MHRKKMAFTLMEVLITLAVIGVVAALILPAFIHNFEKKTSAVELARAVELTHTGIANVMHQVGKNNEGGVSAEKLSDIKASDVLGDISSTGITDNYMTNAQTLYTTARGPMGITEVDNSYLSNVKTYSGSAITSTYSNFASNKVYQFIKRHSVMIAENINDGTASNAGSDVVIERIFFDVNGSKKPNVLGRDIFLFGLTNGGQLVPAGSAAYNNNILNEQIPLYTEACADSVSDARACSARIMHDRWEIKY